MTAPALADKSIIAKVSIKENEPPALRKKFAPKAQGLKRDKPSRLQGSELPGRPEANEVVAAVAAPEVDAEAALAEAADTRDVASRNLVGLHGAFRAGCPP